jgi:hypothetical protein
MRNVKNSIDIQSRGKTRKAEKTCCPLLLHTTLEEACCSLNSLPVNIFKNTFLT